MADKFLLGFPVSEKTADSVLYQDGNHIGIGTDTPGHKLSVINGNIQTDGNVYTNVIRDNTGGDVSIQDNGGNVGIGTTSPSNKLEIQGSGTVMTRIVSTDSTARLDLHSSGNARTSFSTSAGNTFLIYDEQGGQELARYQGSSNYWAFRTAGTERMRINSSGNVGIGTTSPSYKLDVHNGTAGSGIARFSGADSDDMIIVTESGYMAIDTRNTASGLSFQIQGDDKVRIDSSGNVGIGTDSPSSQFHIYTPSGKTGLRITRANNITGVGIHIVTDSTKNLFNAYGDLLFRTAATGSGTNASERMRIKSNGVINFSNMPTSSSGLSSGDVWSDGGTLKIVS